MDRKIICQKEFKALKPTKLELSRAVLLTRQQLAEYLKVNVRTIDNYRKLHGLPFLKVGNSVRFRIIDVEKWLFFQNVREWGEKKVKQWKDAPQYWVFRRGGLPMINILCKI